MGDGLGAEPSHDGQDGQIGESGGPKPKAKAKSKANAKKGAKGKKGEKLCRGCGQHLPLTQFPAGKALCHRDQAAWRNIQGLAKSQAQEGWLEEQQSDPKLFRELIANYHRVCGCEGRRNKRNAFSIVSYQETQKRYNGILLDEEFELMHYDKYVTWAGDRQNEGLSPSEASARWKELLSEPEAVTDMKGPKRSPLRLAIRVRDVLRKRQGSESSKSVTAASQGKKKATQEDINKELARLSRPESVLDRDMAGADLASQFLASAAAAASSGQSLTFSADHQSQALVGDVKSLIVLDDKPVKTAADTGGKGSQEGSDHDDDEDDKDTAKASSSKGSDNSAGVWWGRDEKIMSELRTHAKWVADTRQSLNSAIQSLQAIQIAADVKDLCVDHFMDVIFHLTLCIKKAFAEENRVLALLWFLINRPQPSAHLKESLAGIMQT